MVNEHRCTFHGGTPRTEEQLVNDPGYACHDGNSWAFGETQITDKDQSLLKEMGIKW